MNFLNRLRGFFDARLQPSYLVIPATAISLFSVAIAVSLFLTTERGRTAFGIPLGADFAGFYIAAEILNRGESSQLYDRDLHCQLYHELLPSEDERVAIPYVHPPFVAGLLRPLARLPYPTAVAIWLSISAGLYLTGTMILLRSLPWPIPRERLLVLLLAFSFEPFAFECWLGGQLSAIAYLSYALCIAALDRSKPVLAGMALGISFYKPTLLLLALPMLVAGRRWRMLLGMTVTGLALATISVMLVGWDVNVGYLAELLSFNKSTSGGDLEIRTWKYVDLNNCLRLILGLGSPIQLPTLIAIGIIPFVWLLRLWWASPTNDKSAQRILWATTMTWTPVLNLYVGIYDSILIVQSALIMAVEISSRSRDSRPLTSSGFAYLMTLIYLVPWFSQNLAAMTGIPLYTGLLMCLGIYQFTFMRRVNANTDSP